MVDTIGVVLQTGLGVGGIASIIGVALSVILLLVQLRYSLKTLNDSIRNIKNDVSNLTNSISRVEGYMVNLEQETREDGGQNLDSTVTASTLSLFYEDGVLEHYPIRVDIVAVDDMEEEIKETLWEEEDREEIPVNRHASGFDIKIIPKNNKEDYLDDVGIQWIIPQDFDEWEEKVDIYKRTPKGFEVKLIGFEDIDRAIHTSDEIINQLRVRFERPPDQRDYWTWREENKVEEEDDEGEQQA